MKFNEAQRNMMVRLTHDLIRTPEGKRWTNPLYKEVMDPKGDYAGVKHEMIEMLSEILNSLFLSDRPVQSR